MSFQPGEYDDPHDYPEADDAAIDRWNDGALAALSRQPAASEDADYVAGYQYGLDQRQVRVVMPKRPEGYYHAPIGTFD
jgi:hypothetical protein